DGRPVLRGHRIEMVQRSDNVLALKSFPPEGHAEGMKLRLFRLPEGTPICEYSQRMSENVILSTDGRSLARQIGEMQIAVHDLSAGSEPLSVTPVGKAHSNLAVELGDRWLIVRIGDRTHLIEWASEKLGIVALSKNEDLKTITAQRGLRLHGSVVAKTTG